MLGKKKTKQDKQAPATAWTDPELEALMELEELERREAASGPVAPGTDSRLDRLQQLGELREQGILSDTEFEREKARILSEP
jgi:Short C-terminal domain